MLIVLNSGNGQMCNQILMQANILASAYKHNYKVKYYGFKVYDGISYNQEALSKLIERKKSNPQIRFLIARIFYNLTKYLSIQNKYVVMASDPESVNFALYSRNLKLHNMWCFGWPFYDLKSLRENVKLIRAYFSPNNELKNKIGNQLDLIKNSTNAKLIIGVHMRKGDYKYWKNGRFYFENDIYKRYMDKFFEQLSESNVTFILFSNEPINIEYFQDIKYNTVIAKGTAIEDFYLMANCDYLIGPPSTYSGLASYFGNIPRFIMTEPNDEIKLDKMFVWLVQTDGWINPI